MSENSPKRIMKLGKTDGFRYIGIKPPLSKDEAADLPLPTTNLYGEEYTFNPTSNEFFDDGTQDIGFDGDAFLLSRETFVLYARRLAKHLGNCALDEEVRMIGPGSLIAQAEGAPPEW